jgi:hypothetical protein
MKIKITQATLCRFRDRPDAACRQRRCASCGARSAPSVHGAVTLCARCRDAAAAEKWRLQQAERLIAEVMGRGAKEGGAE